MNDVIAVKSMADAKETGLKVVMGSLEESRKSARIFIRVIYCFIVLAVVSFETVALVTEHRKETIARQNEAPQVSQYAYGALIPMTNLPQSVWPNLGIQPEGKSSLIEIPKVGMRAVVLGNNLKTHVVYGDKRECIVLEEECKPGAIAFYVSNTSKEMNIVAYAFTY